MQFSRPRGPETTKETEVKGAMCDLNFAPRIQPRKELPQKLKHAREPGDELNLLTSSMELICVPATVYWYPMWTFHLKFTSIYPVLKVILYLVMKLIFSYLVGLLIISWTGTLTEEGYHNKK